MIDLLQFQVKINYNTENDCVAMEGSGRVWGLESGVFLAFLLMCLWSWAASGMFQEKTKSTLIPLNKLSKSLHLIFPLNDKHVKIFKFLL